MYVFLTLLSSYIRSFSEIVLATFPLQPDISRFFFVNVGIASNIIIYTCVAFPTYSSAMYYIIPTCDSVFPKCIHSHISYNSQFSLEQVHSWTPGTTLLQYIILYRIFVMRYVWLHVSDVLYFPLTKLLDNVYSQYGLSLNGVPIISLTRVMKLGVF